MDTSLPLRIVVEKPLGGIDYALQSGSGSKFGLVQHRVSDTENMIFTLSAKVKGDEKSQPDFGGPFVQGSKGDRFIYVNIGAYAGNPDSEWGRRLKIPLRDITWEVIGKVITHPDMVLETRVPGKGGDGTPSCATVKPFDGWKVKSK